MSLAVNVMDVVDSRSVEITAAMEALKTNMGVSYKLSIPFHMRRRAASHNPKRLPARARPHDAEKSKVKFKWKPRSGRKSGDEKKAKRLETHLWHAKRCHMADLWGYRISLSTTQKGERAAYRAIKTSTTLHDTSYYHWYSVVGDNLSDKLRGVLVPNCCVVNRAISCYLYHEGVCLGPVLVIWVSEECVYIRLHPAIQQHNDLETVFGKLPVGSDNSLGSDDNIRSDGVVFRSHVDTFSQFTVRGVRAMELIVKTLQLSEETSSKVRDIWNDLSCDPYQYDVMKGVVMATKIVVPPPQHKLYVSVLNSPIKQPPERLTPSSVLCTDLLFKPDPRDLENITCSSRDQEQITCLSRDLVTSCCIFRDPLTGSLTVMLPAGTGTRVWIPLIYNGGRVIGMQDEHSLNTDAGVPTFPSDFPDTPGGRSFLEQIGTEAKEKELRRPPQKRVKYEELGIPSPFISDWAAIVSATCGNEKVCGGRDVSVIRNHVQLHNVISLSDDYNSSFVAVSVSCEKRGNLRAGSHLILPEDHITSHDTIGDPVYTAECNNRVIGYVTSGKYCLGSGKGGGLALILVSTYKHIGEGGRLLARNTTSKQFRFVTVSLIR